jgi:hypothetical protein
MPPDPGYIDPSSANDRAPHMVRNPPTNHTSNTAAKECRRAAMMLGTRKIPDPMVVPTTTATASKRFNSLCKLG